jgi:hypothetical protein
LLGDPSAGRVGRAASEPHAPACMRDEEQHVVPAQEPLSTVKKSQATMLAAWLVATRANWDLTSAGPAQARGGRAPDGSSFAIPASPV